MKTFIITLITGALLTGTLAMAEDPKPKSEVGKRAANQQGRIGQGVKNGSLTPKETINLEKKESAIHQEVHTDRKLNGGALTTAEKKQVNQQQNQVSKQIYNKKHNATKQ